MEIIKEGSGTLYDEKVVNAFRRWLPTIRMEVSYYFQMAVEGLLVSKIENGQRDLGFESLKKTAK